MNRSLVVVLLVLACSPVAVAQASPVVRGSVEQVHVTGAKPGEKLLLKRHGDGVGLQRAGALGGAVFRRVAPGGGYRVAGKRVRDPVDFTVIEDRTYIACLEPALPLLDESRARVRADGWDYAELLAGHDAMITHPREVAGLI